MPDTRLKETREGMTFLEVLEMCLMHKEFRAEWERLSKMKLVASSPLDRLIDQATGYDQAMMRKFADDVYEIVFTKLGEI